MTPATYSTLGARVAIALDKRKMIMFAQKWMNRVNRHSTGGAMTDGPPVESKWQRVSCEGGQCLEFAASDEAVMVRTSTSPDKVVQMSRDEWRQFLVSAKDGLLDSL